ncbi:probable E3 ubiquitin-protein ligase HECTD4 [Pimephales promelas]|uniref:probable E3 ubiquitin-protein ligase HECTD4 n=1 Tax=Pimephales promelas TaxID=90988 RepID=UPI0019555BE3|nr:probable E3 ubiquitin-protein ligase HECTD4 [Pimephales promelas]
MAFSNCCSGLQQHTLAPPAGDVAGIGWERLEGTPPPPGQPPKGRVYFTYCGQRLAPYLEDVAGGMWPVVHIQKKNTKIHANFGCRLFAYAEGQAHRNAADLCMDLSEEISANFEALPFAMASDSDNDAGTSVASDSGSHGPPCRIAAVVTAQQQYNSDASCHYKVELSYENLVVSGPNAHPPLIADDESDDEDDEDIPREDHYALLVKAWETKVFPTIRRRFRNEAERKSGLDQIKGALQLGMVDIARQTVEFLYEENGGIPRDLYLPTIEDIKDEANKFTIDKVRKGLTVGIRCPEGNNTCSSTGGTALPKFAIRGMLKTFGLHGVVLDVDSANELVQVETYLRSEGVLVRYWYPIEMLERPPAGSRRAAANGLVSLDSSNIQIHRELLRCESSLARLYCRMALLNIFAPKSPHTFTRLFHIPAVRDITLEHLQLLSNQLLAPPLPDGRISSNSILLAQSVLHELQGKSCSSTELFYQGNAQTISEWLTVAISRALHQGEDSLLELTKQICCFLQAESLQSCTPPSFEEATTASVATTLSSNTSISIQKRSPSDTAEHTRYRRRTLSLKDGEGRTHEVVDVHEEEQQTITVQVEVKRERVEEEEEEPDVSLTHAAQEMVSPPDEPVPETPVSQQTLPGDPADPPETAPRPDTGTTSRATDPAQHTPDPPRPDGDRLPETQSRESLDEEVAATTDIYFYAEGRYWVYSPVLRRKLSSYSIPPEERSWMYSSLHYGSEPQTVSDGESDT